MLSLLHNTILPTAIIPYTFPTFLKIFFVLLLYVVLVFYLQSASNKLIAEGVGSWEV